MNKKTEKYDVNNRQALLARTAGITGGRPFKTPLIEKALVGGLATYTSEIGKLSRLPEGSSGLGLMDLVP